MTLGADTSSWCSPENPTCSAPLKGICKPMTPAALEAFKEFQRQLNRALVALGKAPISVDGRLGPGTVSAANDASRAIRAATGTNVMVFDDCNDIAANGVTGGAAQFKAFADSKGTPAIVNQPSSSPPSIIVGNQVQNPADKQITSTACNGLPFLSGLWCKFKLMPTWQQAGIGAIAGLGALFALGKIAPKKAAGK